MNEHIHNVENSCKYVMLILKIRILVDVGTPMQYKIVFDNG